MHGILLIADEVQTGAGRTGTFFANFNVRLVGQDLEAGVGQLVQLLGHGSALETAVQHALEASAQFDLNQCLALLISHDAITHLHLEQKVLP